MSEENEDIEEPESDVIKVKRNHIMAAKMMIERYERGVGPKPSPVVIAIANAKRKPAAD